MAAIQAAESGADKVLVLDKMPGVGGDTGLCGGGVHAIGTKVQEDEKVVDPRTGKPDAAEQGVKDWLKAGGGVENEALVKQLVAESPKVIEWFTARGIEWYLILAGPDPVPRAHCAKTSGKGLVDAMVAEIKKHSNISLLTNTTVLEILQDPKTNRVVGVRAATNDGIKYYGGKVVVIAMGGVGANLALTQQYNPESSEWINSGGTFATGDWVPLTDRLRASFVGTRSKFRPVPTFSNVAVEADPAHGISFFGTMPYPMFKSKAQGVVIVNLEGKRVADEADPADGALGIAVAQQAGGGWVVHDQAFYDDPENIFYLAPRGSRDELAKALESGIILKAESIDELITKMRMSATALKQTIENYNGYAATGSDPEFKRAANTMASIKTGPFYAFKIVTCSVTPWVGANISLDVNSSCKVLDVDGKPIPGLYAVGVGVANWRTIGYAYPGGGSCLGIGFAMGNIVGRAAAAEAKTIS